MSSNVKSELILEGLSCANCAANIELEINKLPEIKNANVNFALKKLNCRFAFYFIRFFAN